MVSNKEMMKEIAEPTDCGVPSGASRHNDSPSAGSGTDSGSPSPVSTATHSDNEDVPNDLDLQEDEGQKGKGRKRILGKEPRTRKKGQKFQCTGYGDCALTFTRSEHLSRHIRKHTGEKPYRCFCNRDFSRLDNLRQHAFTVHEPSEIPPGWEHAVKCQSKTARNTEGRRKEANVRRARKREVRAKRATTPETPPPASHPPAPKGVSGTPSQRNSYQEYSQGQLQHQQAPVLRQLPMHQPQPQLHHQQGFGHHQQAPVHHQASTPHQAPSHPQSALHHPPTVHRQQLSIHSQAPLHHQQPPVRRQQTPVQQHHAPPLPHQGYHPSPIRARPQSLILPSQAHHEPSFHGYRHTTPPQSPQSTPQTPRAGYNHASDSTLTTPTTANFHHHRNSLSSGPQTPAGGWNDANRRLSMPYGGGIEFGSVLNPSPRAPIARARRDPIEAEENRRKRMTWHGVEDTEISNIVSPLEHTHLDDPRPLRRPRASTYVPAAAPATMALPSVESLLNPVASTPRTIPLVPSALSPRAADRRPSSGRFEHSRSRSASHIQPNPDPFTPLVTRATYQDSLADRLADARGQRRQVVINGSRFGSPEGPSQDANGIFREAMTFRHSRSDSTDSLAPPRPMEPSFGSAKPEFAPEKAKDNGFVFGERQPASHAVHITRPRAKTSAGANGEISGYVFPRKETPRMELLESEVFEHRPRREGPMNLGNLDYLATICKQRIEEEKPGLNRVGP